MRRPNRPPPRPAVQAPDDFDRMCWEVCKFGNGGARRHTTHAGQPTCDCQNRNVASCDSVRPTVTAILNILRNRR